MSILFSLFHYALSFYLLAVILRWYLPLIRADYYNPLAQFIVRITQPVLFPLRRLIPSIRGVDSANIVLILLIEAFEIVAIILMVNGTLLAPLPLITVVVAGVARILVIFFTTIFIGIIVSAVLSWINPHQYTHQGIRLIASLPAPFLSPLRKWIPPLGGIDFTPMILGFALIYANRIGHTLAMNLLPSSVWFQLIVHPLEFFR